ncbi:uncharacterized protein LOC124294529 [Neodiprion lecontei]|uniref:Uncharacterized protein LOC124294529 n=1 Tax=Neodiprion lecontei TaxID=441921 RepID=A0ABM3G6Y4_NEOLC|nr:uncharacterized protein LOC124294529 [Neodiprion lecontei]
MQSNPATFNMRDSGRSLTGRGGRAITSCESRNIRRATIVMVAFAMCCFSFSNFMLKLSEFKAPFLDILRTVKLTQIEETRQLGSAKTTLELLGSKNFEVESAADAYEFFSNGQISAENTANIYGTPSPVVQQWVNMEV